MKSSAGEENAGAMGAVQQAWKIGVKDPFHDRRLGQIELHDRALGTSGAQFQSFRIGDGVWPHPRSADRLAGRGRAFSHRPAPTAAEADALPLPFTSWDLRLPWTIAASTVDRRDLSGRGGGQPLGTSSLRLAEESAGLLAALDKNVRKK